MNGLANESIARVISTHEFIAINLQAAGGSRAIGGIWLVEALQRAAGGKEMIGVGFAYRVDPRFWRRDVGIASQVMLRHGEVPNQRAVIAAKPVAIIIANSPMLAQTVH